MLGPQVLDHLVRLKHVGTDLAAEVHPGPLTADLSQLFLSTLPFQIQQLGGQHLHGPLSVLMLTPFVLAGGD